MYIYISIKVCLRIISALIELGAETSRLFKLAVLGELVQNVSSV